MVRETTKLPKKSTVGDRDLLILESDYEPAGDQGPAIKGLVEGLNDGLARQILLGVTGSGKTFTVASVIERTQRPYIYTVLYRSQLGIQDFLTHRPYFPGRPVPSSPIACVPGIAILERRCQPEEQRYPTRKTYRFASDGSLPACAPLRIGGLA